MQTVYPKMLVAALSAADDAPFWWKIIILSSGSFMKNELKKEIKPRFSVENQVFPYICMRIRTELNFKRFVKNKKTIYNFQNHFICYEEIYEKQGGIFERNPF